MNPIDISQSLRQFETHLMNNPRTIFSARFGDGKTYFLNHYIELHSDDTVFVTVHPINYSVAKNEDVFEYIKRDILYVLSKDQNFKEVDWTKVKETLFDYDNLLEVADKIGENVPFSNLLLMPFHLFKKVDDKYAIDKFFDRFNEKQGGLFELDEFTVAIKETVAKIQSAGKKCTLLIEDLDRLDPGHLFRILNVLGAHIDEDAESNKFGFDNIILSFDFETTKHLFRHFYGDQADYDGYMSKFLSHTPFYYSITNIARENLRSFLQDNCGVSPEMMQSELFCRTTERGALMSLNNIIDSLSVRDIAKIMDSLETQVSPDSVTCQSYKIDTCCPITSLLAVIARMNEQFRHDKLVEILTSSIDGVKIMDACILFDERIFNGMFEIKREHFELDHQIGEDGFQKIRYQRMMGGVPNPTKIKDIVGKALQSVYPLVHDCRPVNA